MEVIANADSDDARKELRLQYKTLLGETVKTLIDLELAIDRGDADAAVELVEQLVTNKNDGHEVFVPAE